MISNKTNKQPDISLCTVILKPYLNEESKYCFYTIIQDSTYIYLYKDVCANINTCEHIIFFKSDIQCVLI